MSQIPTQKRNQRNIYTILGMAAGAAIGAGVALVYSPGTGDQNRTRLQQWVQSRIGDAQGQVQGMAGDLQNKAQQAASQGADWATARAADVRDKAQDVAKSAAETAQGVINRDNGTASQDATTAAVAPETITVVVPEDQTAES
jgi:gas vesicle protein